MLKNVFYIQFILLHFVVAFVLVTIVVRARNAPSSAPPVQACEQPPRAALVERQPGGREESNHNQTKTPPGWVVFLFGCGGGIL